MITKLRRRFVASSKGNAARRRITDCHNNVTSHRSSPVPSPPSPPHWQLSIQPEILDTTGMKILKICRGELVEKNTLTKPCCCKIQEFKMSPSGYKMHIRSDIEMLNCHFVNHTLQRENDRVFAESGTISHKSAPIPSQSQSSLNIVILSV